MLGGGGVVWQIWVWYCYVGGDIVTPWNYVTCRNVMGRRDV